MSAEPTHSPSQVPDVPPGSSMPFSRVIAIGMSTVVAGVQATRGHWFEVAGLLGIAAGLVMFRLARRRPILRWVAWGCFVVTVAAVIHVYRRDY